MPRYAIDYGTHDGVISLHVHYYKNGNRTDRIEYLDKEHDLYKRHEKLFKGVKI